MRAKNRLDLELVARGLALSREKARAYIMAGEVYVNGQKVDKPASPVLEDDELIVKGAALPFVSRGGLKLAKALQVFQIDLRDEICLDVGASTGGFTDCMLQEGAAFVYALDVGYGQLDWKLRSDDRVCVLERHNARYMEGEWFKDKPGFAGMDVSFISIALILPALYKVLAEGGQVVALVKPQFEAGREQVGKKGVVRDLHVHISVLEKAMASARTLGFAMRGLDFSPVTGPQGNMEFLMHLAKGGIASEWAEEEDQSQAERVAEEAHEALN